MKFGIVVSEYYWDEITSKMLDLSIKICEENKIETSVIKVPGCFDIALPVKQLLQQTDIDGIITLGAIIQGETAHDEVIASTLAKTLQELSLQYEKPVVLGVNGPKMSKEQAIARISRAEVVTKVCMKMVEIFE